LNFSSWSWAGWRTALDLARAAQTSARGTDRAGCGSRPVRGPLAGQAVPRDGPVM